MRIRQLVVFFFFLLLSSYAFSEVTELNWAGCGITKKAFMAEIAKAYEVKYGVHINLEGGGATKGIVNTKIGRSHIGGTCRLPIHNVKEESQLNHITIVAWDALVVVTHPEAPIDNITRDELIAILEGKLTKWDQLSSWKGKRNKKIQLITRASNLSGVGFTYRKMLFGDVYKEINAYKEFPSSGPVEKYIEKNEYAMAITGVSSANKRDLNILSFQNIKPSFDNIKTGAYQFYRPLYLVAGVTHKFTKEVRREIVRFVNFVKSDDGAQVIRDNGVVPYIDAVHLIAKQPNIFAM